MTFIYYSLQVIDYLEYLYYPDLVRDMDPVEWATKTARSIEIIYNSGYSHRTCALIIYGATWKHHVLPKRAKQRVM